MAERRKGGLGKPKKDWTLRLETAKVYLYLVELLVFIIYIVIVVVREQETFQEGYFDLPVVLIPSCIIIVLLGLQGVVFNAIIGRYREDYSDRYRHLQGAKRAAIAATVASFVIFIIVIMPFVQDAMGEYSGKTVEETKETLFKTFENGDVLNLTRATDVRITNKDQVEYNVSFYLGDSVSDGVLLQTSTNVTVWEYQLPTGTREEYLVSADTDIPGAVTWKLEIKTEVRPGVMEGIGYPFLLLGIANLLWAPIAHIWTRRTEDEYVETKTKKLRAAFKIEEAFLIYEDGRLIAHNSRRLKPERDKDIMTGMLTAVQSFVTDTFIDEERGTLDELKYGNLSILVEGSGRVNLACIISGEDSPVLRKGMQNIVSYISQHYRPVLEGWDGDISRFMETKRYIGHLVSTGREEPVWPDELFLLHRDGRLIAHQTSRLEPSIDDEMLNGWVEEILRAVTASMEDPSAPMISRLTVMNYKVSIEYTNYLIFAYLTTKPETEELRELLVEILQDIDQRFHDILYDWDGATSELTDLKVMMEAVFGLEGE